MKIIFLDIDGVLNCKTSRSRCGGYVGIDDDKLSLLAEIVRETGAEIALVSTWKNNWQKSEKDKFRQDSLANYLDEKFKRYNLKVYDKTSDSRDGLYFSRGESILDFIYRNNVENYVVLDDVQFDYDGCGLTDNLVKTDMKSGLTPINSARAKEILNGRKRQPERL